MFVDTTTPDPLQRLMELEGVPSGFVAARGGIDAILRDRGMRKTTAEQTAESLLRGAYASAYLEGSESSLAEIRAGQGDAIAQAAVAVSTQILGIAPTLKHAPVQAFARLHAIAGRGSLPEAELGRPVSAHAAQRLQSLGKMIMTSQAPALLIACIAHAEIATVAPFASHNGIVARAVERAIIAIRGVDPTSVVVPEAGYLRRQKVYESNLQGYARGGRQGVHLWLLYVPEAYTAAAEASPLSDGVERKRRPMHEAGRRRSKPATTTPASSAKPASSGPGERAAREEGSA